MAEHGALRYTVLKLDKGEPTLKLETSLWEVFYLVHITQEGGARMKIGSTFYLSRVLGNVVHTKENKSIGRLKDFVVDIDAIRPRVIAARIKQGKEILTIPFESLQIEKVHAQYRLTCVKVEPAPIYPEDSTFLLAKSILDKQLIDINGRKLVRVNDIRLATLSAGTFVVAVDVGVEGLLRRLGVAKPTKKLLQPLHISIPSNLLLWDEIEAADFGQRGIRLSKESSRLATMHPSDLADILEDLDVRSQLDMFTSLDEDTKLDVLEELESEAQVSVVEQLSVSEAASILERMPSDEAADILDELDDSRATEILNAMQPESSNAIQTLLEYEEDTVGSLMTTDHLCFQETATAQEVIDQLRLTKPEADRVYYLYVVDEAQRLNGTISLRDLIIAEPDAALSTFTDENIIFVKDTDDTDVLFDLVDKYNLLAVPVVDREAKLVGVVTINDLVHNLKRTRRGRF